MKIINYTLFKHQYSDPKLIFFKKLFLEAKKILQNATSKLERAVLENDRNKWFSVFIAIESVAKDMCFEQLEKAPFNLNKVTREDIDRFKKHLKDIIEENQNILGS